MGAFLSLWNELGPWTKLGLSSQAATCGLLVAASYRPSRALCIAALVTGILGFSGLSLVGIGEAEYVICGAFDPPDWCSRMSVGR